jgi:microcompartment protein CcmK/EutM
MVIVQPLNNARQPEADPVIAVDKLGSAPGSVVVLNSDGKGARELIGDEKSPARWFVIGIVDE